MIAQNASSDHIDPTRPQSYGRACAFPADALENAKAVLSFLDIAVCAALSDRSAELDGQQVFGLGLIFQATLASLDHATTGMRVGDGQDDAYRSGYDAGLEEGKRLILSAIAPVVEGGGIAVAETFRSADTYPRFDPAPDPEQDAPPHAAAG